MGYSRVDSDKPGGRFETDTVMLVEAGVSSTCGCQFSAVNNASSCKGGVTVVQPTND